MDLLTDLPGDHPETRQDNQEEEGLQASHRLGDHLVLHLHHRLRRLLGIPHRVSRELLQSPLRQHQRIRRSPTSKRQRTSPRQGNGIVSGDRPSSTLRKIDGISTMTKKLFDSC
jgi:hypothetical protein